MLCEDRASLLADQDRPALVWALPLDTEAVLQHTDVRRAVIRSRRKLDYPGVQAMIDDGSATPDLQLLKEIGQLRQADARRRDAVDLPTPEQEVDTDGNLTYRAQLPCKQWNAQLSLLTGMAAAKVMLDGGVGLLRTLPAPDPQSVDSLRRSALALGVAWPEGTAYGDVLSGLDPSQPAAAALLTLATRLLRGAVYTAFDGTLLELHTHSAVAAPYAHCMAPLRRLAARYVGEVCLALCAGTEIPSWARQALPALPAEMATAVWKGVKALREGDDPGFNTSTKVAAYVPGFLMKPMMMATSVLLGGFGWPVLGQKGNPLGSVFISNVAPLQVEEVFLAPLPFARTPVYISLGIVTDRAVVRDGKVVVVPQFTLSLTGDHRLVDGVQCAMFFDALKRLLADPDALGG